MLKLLCSQSTPAFLCVDLCFKGSRQLSASNTPEYAPDADDPEGTRAWLPYASLVMLSPVNQTYTTNNLTLSVSGGIVISVEE